MEVLSSLAVKNGLLYLPGYHRVFGKINGYRYCFSLYRE